MAEVPFLVIDLASDHFATKIPNHFEAKSCDR